MPSGLRREGYLLIDNRDSPGVPDDLVRASGREFANAPAGKMFESATKTCCHCQTIVVLNPDRTRPRGYCRKCDNYVCDNPQCNLECVPAKKVLDVAQENAFRADNGMNLIANAPHILRHPHPEQKIIT